MNFPQRTALPDPVSMQLALARSKKGSCPPGCGTAFPKHSLSACYLRGSEPLASSIFIYSLHLAR